MYFSDLLGDFWSCLKLNDHCFCCLASYLFIFFLVLFQLNHDPNNFFFCDLCMSFLQRTTCENVKNKTWEKNILHGYSFKMRKKVTNLIFITFMPNSMLPLTFSSARTQRCFNAHTTSITLGRRRIDVKMTFCEYWVIVKVILLPFQPWKCSLFSTTFNLHF